MLNVNYSSIKLEEKNYITFSAFIQKQLRIEYARNGENWMQFFFCVKLSRDLSSSFMGSCGYLEKSFLRRSSGQVTEYN